MMGWSPLEGSSHADQALVLGSDPGERCRLPAVSAEDREKMIAAGQKFLDARALHPDRPLADQYNPLAMDPALVKTHAALDRVMASLLGLSAGTTDKERQTRLIELYATRV